MVTTQSQPPSFQSTSPYKDDILALPVMDLDVASNWYCHHFTMMEVERHSDGTSVILERNGVQIGFAINTGGDPSQEGAIIVVSNIHAMHAELEAKGVKVSVINVNEHNGEKANAFFVVAPDGLCYYLKEALL